MVRAARLSGKAFGRKQSLKKTSTIFGVVTIVFWLSLAGWFVVYPLPLEIWLADPTFKLAAVGMALGIISGVLLIIHPTSGRVLAMALCTFTIGYRLWWFLFPYSDFGKKLYTVFFFLLLRRPIYVIHVEIIAWVFFITTILFLWRKPTA